MFEQIKEEWRTSATRHKVGIVVLVLVIFGVMLFAPAERKIRAKPVYTPTRVQSDGIPCAIFELSRELPDCVRQH